MRALKWIVIGLLVYAGIVAAFESLIGYFQPGGEGTLVITTIGPDGSTHDRVLSHLQSDGNLYVAANHWPRAWYRRAVANPEVAVAVHGKPKAKHTAIPVLGAEHERVDAEHGLPLVFRVLTGFPPRYFLRLDPR